MSMFDFVISSINILPQRNVCIEIHVPTIYHKHSFQYILPPGKRPWKQVFSQPPHSTQLIYHELIKINLSQQSGAITYIQSFVRLQQPGKNVDITPVQYSL